MTRKKILPRVNEQNMRVSRNFCQGGGGGGRGWSRSIWQKSSDNVFLVLSLFYKSQMVNFKENYHFSRFLPVIPVGHTLKCSLGVKRRGSNIFQAWGGGPTFSGGGGGLRLLIPYRNPYNLWFSRGGPDPPVPPVWIRTCKIKQMYFWQIFQDQRRN